MGIVVFQNRALTRPSRIAGALQFTPAIYARPSAVSSIQSKIQFTPEVSLNASKLAKTLGRLQFQQTVALYPVAKMQSSLAFNTKVVIDTNLPSAGVTGSLTFSANLPVKSQWSKISGALAFRSSAFSISESTNTAIQGSLNFVGAVVSQSKVPIQWSQVLQFSTQINESTGKTLGIYALQNFKARIAVNYKSRNSIIGGLMFTAKTQVNSGTNQSDFGYKDLSSQLHWWK